MDQISPKMTIQAAVSLVLLILLGFLGNYFAIPLFFGADFLLGSVAVLIVLRYFGLVWGLAAAVAVHSYTFWLWGHPYGFLTFMLEALWVGLLLRAGHKNILMLDGLFWVVIGTPLNWFCYDVMLHMNATTTAFVILKQGINGIFNALLANLVINYLPLDRFVGRAQTERTFSLQETSFNLLVTLILVPGLLLTTIQIRDEMGQIETNLVTQLQTFSTNIGNNLDHWYLNKLSRLGGLVTEVEHGTLPSPGGLQHDVDLLRNSSPDFRTLHVENAMGVTTSCSPANNAFGSTIGVNLSERDWFREVKATRKAVISDVMFGRYITRAPTVILGVPLVRGREFIGSVGAAIDLEQVTDLLKSYGNEQGMIITLSDPHGHVIASTAARRLPLQAWDARKGGVISPVNASVFRWSPGDRHLPSMTRWNKSYFVQETRGTRHVPWTLTVETSLAPYQKRLYSIYVRDLAIMVALSLLAMLLARVLSSMLAKPLETLAQATTGLPGKIIERQHVVWPESMVAEISSLIGNFKSMGHTLQQYFQAQKENEKVLAGTNSKMIAEINERKQAEAINARLMLHQRAILDNLPMMAWLKDTESRLIMVNAAYADSCGHTIAECLGKTDLDLYPAEWAQKYLADDREVCRTRLKKQVEEPIDTPQGTKWAFTCKTPLFDEAGTVVGTTGIALDITELRKGQEELRRSQELLAEIIKQSPIPMAIATMDGTMEHFNRRAIETFGYTLEDIPVLERWWVQAYPDPSYRSEVVAQWAELVEKAIAERSEIERREYRVTCKDGTTRTVRIFGMPVSDRIFVIFDDITDQKKAETERMNLERQLLHAQKLESLGVLAGGIAHDFNNILAVIIGNADLALMRIGKESPLAENLNRIEQAAARAADLARQMLAYSGKGKFIVEKLDFNLLLKDMLHMLEISISKKAVLKFDFREHLPIVEGDATQIRQIVMNLVINASEAIGERSGVITITTGSMECDRSDLQDIWLDEDLHEGVYVFMEVADTGCGMDRETQSRLFDPFFTTKFTGRGLGMAAVLGIVRGHKGAIKVYSEPGRGTTFRVLLPASAKTPPMVPAEQQADDWHGSGVVLLVDDEATIRDIGKEMLEALGFTVITANDGREAIDIFKANADIAFTILDLTMPHMDGEQCFRELRLLDPSAKVILSSGFSEHEVTKKFAGKGLAGFVQKPYKLSSLKQVIQRTCC